MPVFDAGAPSTGSARCPFGLKLAETVLGAPIASLILGRERFRLRQHFL
jgi:hypothetical protein